MKLNYKQIEGLDLKITIIPDEKTLKELSSDDVFLEPFEVEGVTLPEEYELRLKSTNTFAVVDELMKVELVVSRRLK